ncbi:unnamed protein product [Ilex paraguariensis]|uniref:Uncharacterized protein n=1 Tax=Ilex paraguariensis TaxID=185542 RepID=A0ABC8TJU2_9AQUA
MPLSPLFPGRLSHSYSLSRYSLIQAWQTYQEDSHQVDCADLRSVEREKMNRCGYQQKVLGICGEMRGESICASGGVVCPKPRRLGGFNPSINDHIRPSRCHINYQTGVYEAKAGTEVLDIIFTKGSYGVEKPNTLVASSPPFFSGSPPSRASNPVIQDSNFGVDKLGQLAPALEASPSPSSARKNGGGCVRAKFSHKPAAVRIEGFNCRGISAVA